MKYLLALLLTLCLAVTAFAETLERDASGEIVSTSHYDIDHDGELERVDIYVASGRHYVDDKDWCGKGEKWEGVFRVRITDNRKLLRDNHDPLEAESLFAPEFELKFADYNADGNIDFNLVQYAGCLLREAYLYTIYPGGRVERLDVDGGLLVTTRDNSTDKITALGNGCFTTEYHDITRGDVVDIYCWNSSMFFLKDSVVMGGVEGGE